MKASEQVEVLQAFFVEANDAFLLFRLEPRVIVDLNPAALRLIGSDRSEIIGRNPLEYLEAEAESGLDRLHRSYLEDGQFHCEEGLYLRRGDGRRVPVEVRARRLEHRGEDRGLLVCRDISERLAAKEARRRFEAQAEQAEGLESLGVLAGGVAHDFNNLLIGILGNAEIALTEIGERSAAAQPLRLIEVSARRAAELTRQLLAFTGRGKFTLEPVHLTALAEEMTQLLELSTPDPVLLSFEFGAGLPYVEGDAAQLRQVIMNLLTNAVEAMGSGSGRVTIRTDVCQLEAREREQAMLGDEAIASAYVVLEVEDTGCGMSAEVREKIFDPFFSTKYAGRGLGLSSVLSIVRGHRGAIQVQSKVEGGSVFRVLLPIPSARPELAAPTTAVPGRTILIIDDEEPVREFARRALQRHGFSVEVARSGTEGLHLLHRASAEIDMVLLDTGMPDLDGTQVLCEIRRHDSKLPIILSSGYRCEQVLGRSPEQLGVQFLEKPYGTRVLLREIRRALGD